MNWKDIAAKAAPVLGTLIGGPAGGSIGGMIAGALGVDNTDTALTTALADPEQAAKLKQWAYQHREKLEQMALDTLKAELADKADARANHKHSVMPAIIAVVLIVMTASLCGCLMFVPIPEENATTVYMIAGQLLGWTGAAIAYWVGTTRSSAEKTRQAVR